MESRYIEKIYKMMNIWAYLKNWLHDVIDSHEFDNHTLIKIFNLHTDHKWNTVVQREHLKYLHDDCNMSPVFDRNYELLIMYKSLRIFYNKYTCVDGYFDHSKFLQYF